MLDLSLGAEIDKPLEILCIGAHCDDIEIGCGGTLMRWIDERKISVTWVVLTSTSRRALEVRRCARTMLKSARRCRIQIKAFKDGFLPEQWGSVKRFFETLKRLPRPDLIFTHSADDMHQDHRIASELTWNTFRNHLIFEYEIAKYDGDLSRRNCYVALGRTTVERKAKAICSAYVSQLKKAWFTPDAFRALMRLRGLECNAPEGYAEAFHARKVRF